MLLYYTPSSYSELATHHPNLHIAQDVRVGARFVNASHLALPAKGSLHGPTVLPVLALTLQLVA